MGYGGKTRSGTSYSSSVAHLGLLLRRESRAILRKCSGPEQSAPSRICGNGTGVLSQVPRADEPALGMFYQTHPELRSQQGDRSARRVAGLTPDDQELRREFIRFLWGESLNSVEREQLRNGDRQQLDRLMLDYRRRARLQVLENFSHAESPEFEAFTNLDGPSCGFDFVEGETYLVEVHRNNLDQRWKVSSCSPPRLASAAPDEVNALRAFASVPCGTCSR